MRLEDWGQNDIMEFSKKLYKSLVQVHLARVKFKSTDEELQKLSKASDMQVSVEELRVKCFLFQCSAIKMMSERIREGNSWIKFWAAPQWILALEPSFGIVEKALQGELLTRARPDPLERLLGDLAATAAGAAHVATHDTSADAVVVQLPARHLHAAWTRLYHEARTGARALWAAGDTLAADAHARPRMTAAHWRAVDVGLYCGAEPAHVTKESLVEQDKVQALKVLIELISEAYACEPESGAHEPRALRVTTEPGSYNFTIESMSVKDERPDAAVSKAISISKEPGQYNLTIESSGARDGREEGGLLQLSAGRERALWIRVHDAYIRSGRYASVLTLQWRWHGLRELVARLAATLPTRAASHPLLYVVLLRFPWTGEHAPPSWSELRRTDRLLHLQSTPPEQEDAALPYERELEAGMYYFRQILKSVYTNSTDEQQEIDSEYPVKTEAADHESSDVPSPATPSATPPATSDDRQNKCKQERTKSEDKNKIPRWSWNRIAYDEKLTKHAVVVVTKLQLSAQTAPASAAPVRSARLKQLGHRSALPTGFWRIKRNMTLLKSLKPVHVLLERVPALLAPPAPPPPAPHSPELTPHRLPQFLLQRSPAVDVPVHRKAKPAVVRQLLISPGPAPAPALSSDCVHSPAHVPDPVPAHVTANSSCDPHPAPSRRGTVFKKKKKSSKKLKKKESLPRKRRRNKLRPVPQWTWPKQPLTPQEEWERQKNITAPYFSLPSCPLRPPRPSRPVSDIYRNMKTTNDAPVVISDDDEPPPTPPAPPLNITKAGDPELVMPIIANVRSLAPAASARGVDMPLMNVSAGGGSRAGRAASEHACEPADVGGLGVLVETPPNDAEIGAHRPQDFTLSLHDSITVDQYLERTLSLTDPLFRLDAAEPLWTLLGDYILVTSDNLPVAAPTYWVAAGTTGLPSCTRVLLPRDSPAPPRELLVCECAAGSPQCALCTCIAVLSGPRVQPPAQQPRSAAAPPGKIQVKAFAKMADDDYSVDSAPLVIHGGGKTFARVAVAPLTYRSTETLGDDDGGDLRLVNKALQRRLRGDRWVSVMTAVNSVAAARRLARAGRPLRCTPFRTAVAASPAHLHAELQRVLSEPDPLAPSPPAPPH